MEDINEYDNADQLNFTIKIPRVNQQYDISLGKDVKISEFFNAISDLVNADVKLVRLMYNGQRIINDQNKSVGDEFAAENSNLIDITVFTESQGASI